jgi:NADPH2:quinone reductase
MKQIVMRRTGGPEVLALEEAAVPAPGPGQILVRVEASGINYADLMQRLGAYVEPTPLPIVPGMEVAGTVEAVGPGVDHLAPGARVLGFTATGGGYAQFAQVEAMQAVPLPDALGSREATALAIQGLTAWLLLTEVAPVGPGKSVLVHAAAGGVGTLAVQIARLRGADRIVATASTEEKLALARQLGAHIAVNYSNPDWPDRILAATGGQPVDVVLETVGGSVLADSLKVLAPFGRLVTFGAASGERATVETLPLLARNQTVTGFYLGGWFGRGSFVPEALGALLHHVGTGEIEVPPVTVFPLAEAAEAHAAIHARRTSGKVVLDPWE